jgi:hypothetical protein
MAFSARGANTQRLLLSFSRLPSSSDATSLICSSEACGQPITTKSTSVSLAVENQL